MVEHERSRGVSGANAMHSSADDGEGTNEHYTDPETIADLRRVFGEFDLDPFSCELANKFVGAKKIYTKPDDESRGGGFELPWEGTVLCNPPGGKWKGLSNQRRGWFKFAHEYDMGRSLGGAYVCFSVEFLQVVQEHEGDQVSLLESDIYGGRLPHAFPIFYPAKRMRYWTNKLPAPSDKFPNRKPTKKQVEQFDKLGMCQGTSPPHSSCIVLLPDPSKRAIQIETFEAVFRGKGQLVVPRRFANG